MKTRYLYFSTLILSFLVSYISYSQDTTISGRYVYGTWSNSYSSYLIDPTDIELRQNDSLIIEPGVQIIFKKENASFTVYGSLKAVGNDEDTIIFKSINESTFWQGITFDSDEGNPENQSWIKFCHFENTKDPPSAVNFGSIKVLQHKLDSVEDSRFVNCEQALTLSQKSHLSMVKNCIFDEIFGEYAINLKGNSKVEDFSLVNNKFFNIRQDAVKIEFNQNKLISVTLDKNDFINDSTINSKSSLHITDNSKLEQISLTNNRFEYINRGYTDTSTVYLANNYEDLSLDLDTSIFYKCGSDTALSGGIFIDRCFQVNFSANVFKDNAGYKAGIAFIKANRFLSENDSIVGNTSVFKYGDDESGNGGGIFFRSKDDDGVFQISDSYFEDNSSVKLGGSVFLDISNDFEIIELNNSHFTDGSSSLAGGCLAVTLKGNVDHLKVLHNNFERNRSSAHGGCIYINSTTNNYVTELVSADNYVKGDANIQETESYLYYSAGGLPQQIIFKKDTVEDIGFDTTLVNKDNRVIHFKDVGSDYNGVSFIDIDSSHYENCKHGIFYFNASHDIQDISLYRCSFDTISTITTGSGSMTVKASSINKIIIQGSTFDSIINSRSQGGVMSFSSENDIGAFKIIPIENTPSKFSNCKSNNSRGGCIYVEANGSLGAILIDSTVINNCDASLDGGCFYFATDGSQPNPGEQSLTLRHNDVNMNGGNTDISGSGGFLYYKSPFTLNNIDITANQFKSITAVDSGGAFYIWAGDIQPVTLKSNYFKNISTTGISGDGGVLFLKSDKDIHSITVEPDISSPANRFIDCHSGGKGGCVYAEADGLIGPINIEAGKFENCRSDQQGGSFYLKSEQLISANLSQTLNIVANTIIGDPDTYSSKEEGGFLYYTSQYPMDNIVVLKDTVYGVSSNGAGGAFYVSASDIGPLTIHDNNFTSVFTRVVEADANGGVFYLSSAKNIEGIDLSGGDNTYSNVFSSCYSNGSGGCLFASAEGLIGEVNIQNIYDTNCYAKNGLGGGSFYLYSKNNITGSPVAQSMTISDNVVAGNNSAAQTQGSGGFIYYYSPTELGNLEINSNTFRNTNASGDGGILYAELSGIGMINFAGNSLQNLRSFQNGGVACIKSSKDIGSVNIIPTGENEKNIFTDCSAAGDGGCIYAHAKGLVGNTSILDSKFINCYSGDNGGGLYVFSEKINSGLNNQEINITGNIAKCSLSNVVTGGRGGFIYYSTPHPVSNATFNYNKIIGLNVKGSGGGIFMTTGKISEATFNNNFFNELTCSPPNETADGGAVYLYAADEPITNFFFQQDTLKEIRGFNNGGALNISGKGLLNGTLSESIWQNIWAMNNGGMLYIKSDPPVGNLNISTSSFTITNDEGSYPVKGGAIYISGIDTLMCQQNNFENLRVQSQGGAVCLDSASYSNFNLSGFHSCSSDSIGGAVCVSGTGDAETVGAFGCGFYQNTSVYDGGGFYISRIDTVTIGDESSGNVFYINQNIDEESKGGAIYVSEISSFKLADNKIYGNSSGSGGGLYIDQTDSIDLDSNVFLGNTAHKDAGAAYLFKVRSGFIHHNGFLYCSSSGDGGGLNIDNETSFDDSLNLFDNYFYKNQSQLGGAVLSDYALRMERNLFSKNEVFPFDGSQDFFGSATYLNKDALSSVFYNCVFENNLSSKLEGDGSVYFQAPSEIPVLPSFSLLNCTFINDWNFYSVFSKQQKIKVINSIFQGLVATKNDNSNAPRYFNENVEASYSNLVFTDPDPVNHNFAEFVDFTNDRYYVPCNESPPIIDMGNPDSIFYDRFIPMGCDSVLNDVGMTGGPYNPDSTSLILEEVNDTLSIKDITALQLYCNTYLFRCNEDTNLWQKYYWYLPDGSIIDTSENEITIEIESLLPGTASIKLLAENNELTPPRFGFGITNFIVEKFRIDTLIITNLIPVEECYTVDTIPLVVDFEVYLLDVPSVYREVWKIEEENNVSAKIINSSETNASVEVQQLNPEIPDCELSFKLRYAGTDSLCNLTDERFLAVNIRTGCSTPFIENFLPGTGEIISENDSITINFSQVMVDQLYDEINKVNIKNMYSLTVDGISVVDQAVYDYNIFNKIQNGIIIYLKSDYLEQLVGEGKTLKLEIENEKWLSRDCKVPLSGLSEIEFPVTIGLGEYNDDFNYYPNPTSGKVFIHAPGRQMIRIKVVTILGENILTLQDLNTDSYEIDLHLFPDGMYFIHLADKFNNHLGSFRIIKEQ